MAAACPLHSRFNVRLPFQNIARPSLGKWIGCVKLNSEEEWMVCKRLLYRLVFPLQFLVLPNFHCVSITVWKHGKCFLFLK